MGLSLSISGRAAAGLATPRVTVPGRRFAIGRGADNDWVLPDPERYLSKCHCIVERRGEEWWITDTSSNGLFVGDADRPLGRGQACRLDDGMQLHMGDYTVLVALDEDAATGAPGGDASLFDDPLGRIDEPPATPAEESGLAGLLDESWLGQRNLRGASHPAKREADARPATQHDHVSPEHQALELGSKPRKADPLFDPPEGRETPPPQPPAAPAERGRASGKGPFFPDRDDPFALSPSPATPPTEPPPPPGAPRDPVESSGGDALLQAFLEGAALEAEDLDIADREAFMRDAGKAFAALSHGIAQLLVSRAMVKREIGADQTLIGAAGNNPLKLSANAREAAASLLVHRGPGYLEPLPAIHAALDDLKSHEMAIVAAMQTALTTLLRRFDPASLAAEIEGESAISTLFAGGRKARLWDMFEETYGSIARSARERFMGEIGADFTSAYQRRTEKP